MLGRRSPCFAAGRHQTGAEVRSSPAVAGGRVYFGSYDGSFYALDAETGAERWPLTTADTIHSSPAVVDGTVYVGNMESRLYAVDAATGQVRWHYQAGIDTEIYNQHGLQSSPAVSNGIVYIGGRDGGVHAVDAQSGERLWKFDTNESWVLGSATAHGGLAYFGTSDTNMLRAVDATTGDAVFGAPLDNCAYSSPALVGETLYIGTCGGVVFAVDANTGEVRWQYRTDASREDRHGILRSDGVLDRALLFAGEYTAETAPVMAEKLLDLARGA